MAYCIRCNAPIYHTTKVEGPYFTSDWRLCRQCEISDQLDHAFLVIELDLTTMRVFDSCRWKIFHTDIIGELESLEILEALGLVKLANADSGVSPTYTATELGKSAIVSGGKLYIGVLQ